MNYLVTKKDKFVIFAENGNGFLAKIAVAPLVGAWIEIHNRQCYNDATAKRSNVVTTAHVTTDTAIDIT